MAPKTIEKKKEEAAISDKYFQLLKLRHHYIYFNIL